MPEHVDFDFNSAVSNLAMRKKRAAQARSSERLSDAHSPLVVFLGATSEIAAVFTPRGYRYAKSGPHLSRRAGDLTYTVRFQSSPDNVAGEYVALWIHANVSSKKLGAWRTGYDSSRTNKHVAGGQIGNLLPAHPWMEWNLAIPEKREPTLRDAIGTIERIALPYFDLFAEPETLSARLIREQLPGMGIVSVVEYLLCFAGVELAKQAAISFLHRDPRLLADYHLHLDRFRTAGLPTCHPSGHAEELAYASVLYRFSLDS